MRPLKNVNLLHIVPARMAVSSAVRNPHDFPEYLVDNHLETAWNSTTGDLVGGWIDFKVPFDVVVHRIEMTCGYSRIKDKVDLFTQNHRISLVEVIRDGASLGEFSLDVAQRGLQRIPIDGPGGVYRVLVKATVPGTRRAWRELAVSEFRVMGDPGKELRAKDDTLEVAVGGLNMASSEELKQGMNAGYEFDTGGRAFKSLDALCDTFVKEARRGAAELLKSVSEQGIEKLGSPFCYSTAKEYPIPSNPNYRRGLEVVLSDGLRKGHQLVIELPRGFVSFPVSWNSDDPTDPGCPSIFRTDSIEPLRVENGYLIVKELGYRRDIPSIWLGATWCKDTQGKLTCHAYNPLYGGSLGDFGIAPDGSIKIQGRGW